MFMRSRLAMVLVQAGREEMALEWIDHVARRDPALAWSCNYTRGWRHLALGRFAEAVDALTQTEFNDTHLLLAIAYMRLGRPDKARPEVEKMMKINPTMTVQIWRLGYSFRDAAILERCAVDLAQSGLPA
jgi:tetratricopeptide (TPR) repeat protein